MAPVVGTQAHRGRTLSEFIDKSGKPLAPGDLVVYAVTLGRVGSLAYGKVLGITANGKLRVHKVEKPWYAPPGETPVPQPARKPSLLMYGERVLMIQPDQVPPEFVPVFDAIRPLEGGTFEGEDEE